jgi:PAB-dependent poly(A)-specific ribonuclease subunit 2
MLHRQGRPIADPLVKVYDLRKMQPLPPVSFSAGPGFINTLPRRSSSIVVSSPSGLVTIVDASNPSAVGEFYQVRLMTHLRESSI